MTAVVPVSTCCCLEIWLIPGVVQSLFLFVHAKDTANACGDVAPQP